MALLEVHAVAHGGDEAVPDQWSNRVRRLARDGGDLELTLVAADSKLEWDAIVDKFLEHTPRAWRDYGTAELKKSVSILWREFTQAFNKYPGTVQEAINLSEVTTQNARAMGLTICMAPKYHFSLR